MIAPTGRAAGPRGPQTGRVTIAARFSEEVLAAARHGLEGPELLPERLARAAAALLPVADASISLLEGGDKRVPLGSSSADAGVAERLQFTVGDGPCMAAQRLAEPVFAPDEELRRRWPQFTEQLFERTPYRGVVALPLRQALSGLGAIDLYFRRSERIAELEVFDAMAVGELITAALSEAAVFSEWSPEEGPDWLHAPAARRRALVWQAMGRLGLQLDVDGPRALEILRSHALSSGREVDDVAVDVLADRVDADALRGAR
jgi:hypothetical protein